MITKNKMSKEKKITTPEWILKGYDSKEDYLKTKGVKSKKSPVKGFKVKKCPECGSYDVKVVLGGEEGKGSKGWECNKCKWAGRNVYEDELNEQEFMEYLDGREKNIPD